MEREHLFYHCVKILTHRKSGSPGGAPKVFAWAIRPQPEKNLRNINFELLTRRIRSVLPDDAGGYRSVNILTRGCSLCE